MPSLRRSALHVGGLCLLSAIVTGRASATDEVPPEAVDAGSHTAESEPAVVAENLVKQGIELRKRGDDRAALEAFERALALDDSAQALAQLALAEQALGRWLEAHLHLEGALARGADPWIAANRTTLERARDEIASRLGWLEITCNVEGAEVQLDGRVAAHTPLSGPLRWVAGESILRVSAPGHFVVTRQVKIDAGGLARVNIVLTPATDPAAELSRRPQSFSPPLVELPRRAPIGAPLPASSGSERSDSTLDILTYTSLGLAGVGIAVGVTGYVIREVNASAYNDDARCAVQPDVPRSVQCAGDAAAVRRGEALAIAGFSATGAFGVTALLLWLSRPESADAPALACNIGVLAAGCGGQF